ncbi:MAG: MerR family transcriptional regulator [Bdellovibrionaceae bacterium]|jgi:DNA-binding transcriptional MerR regulator|nr:MerR family transcriptional regulator [Pseudobdellovibrionaceae bacterium]
MIENEIIFETKDEVTEAPAPINFGLEIVDETLASEIRNIPSRLAFKIGDVAKIVGVKSYVLRYWETEFSVLKLKKSKHNQRVYEQKDVENLLIIKKLLYRDRFSIEGARAALKRYKKSGAKAARNASDTKLKKLTEQTQILLTQIHNLKHIFS